MASPVPSPTYLGFVTPLFVLASEDTGLSGTLSVPGALVSLPNLAVLLETQLPLATFSRVFS